MTAHHSFAFFLTGESEDGASAFVTREGTISEIKWLNPHTGVIVSAVDEQGRAEEWTLETRPVVTLYRRGWTRETLQVGSKVTMTANRSIKEGFGRFRGLLVHGDTEDADSRLFVEYLEPPISARLEERLPLCEGISEDCFQINAETLQGLREEFKAQGLMGYLY